MGFQPISLPVGKNHSYDKWLLAKWKMDREDRWGHEWAQLFPDSKIKTIWELEHNLASDYSVRYPSKHIIQSLKATTVDLMSFYAGDNILMQQQKWRKSVSLICFNCSGHERGKWTAHHMRWFMTGMNDKFIMSRPPSSHEDAAAFKVTLNQ